MNEAFELMDFIKEIIRLIAYDAFSIVNRFIPKKQRLFIYGGAELSGNSEAMLRYFVENTELPITCIAEKRDSKYNSARQVTFKDNTLWNAFIATVTSRVVLDSSLHTIKMRPRQDQLFLQMWHGSPLKHLPKSKRINNGLYYSYVCYSSPLFKEEMQKCFGIDDNKMFLTGNPRNDYLFKGCELPKEYSHSGKTVIWMPTFRRGIGLRETSKDIPILNKDNVKELVAFLQKYNIKLFIKPHPLQLGGLADVIPAKEYSAIQLLTDEDLMAHSISLYELLGNTDALITDYSSVYFDYLLIDRPIGFAIDDYKEYSANRGFALHPAEYYMPGKKMQTLQDLIDFLLDLVNERDPYSINRKTINEIVNYFQDANSCKRCAEFIDRYINIE